MRNLHRAAADGAVTSSHVSDATAVTPLFRVPGFVEATLVTLGLVAVLARMRLHPRARAGFGIALVVGVGVGLAVADRLPALLVAGLLCVGGAAWRTARWWLPFRTAALVPGAVLVAVALPSAAPRWVGGTVFVAIVVGCSRAVRLDRRRPALTPVLLAVSGIGVYICVPETSTAGVVAGALLALLLLLVVPPMPSPGGTAVGVTLLVWSAGVGGYPRPGAVIGGVGALGAIWLVARLRRLPRGMRGVLTTPATRELDLVILAIHAVLVLYASRVAGLRESAGSALVVLVPAFVVANFGFILMSRRAARR